MRNLSCYALTSCGTRLIIGTSGGLLQVFSAKTLKSVSTALTLSSSAVNSIDCYEHASHLYLIVSFASGQINLYKSIDTSIQITHYASAQ